MVVGLTAVAGLTGAMALVLGLAAWNDTWAQILAVLVITTPALAAPFITARRLAPLTEAVSSPEETARQAREYLLSLKDSPELNQLAARVMTGRGEAEAVKLGGLWPATRTVARLVGKVQPDPRSQPLLAAYSPANLKTAWLWIIAAWWLWVFALLVAMAAAGTLIVDLVI